MGFLDGKPDSDKKNRHSKKKGEKEKKDGSDVVGEKRPGSSRSSKTPAKGCSILEGSRDRVTITLENIHALLSRESEPDEFTKESVVEMVKCMYTWLTSDPNGQISLPVGKGSPGRNIWPHGAVVDTRRSQEHGTGGEGKLGGIRELDDETISNVSSSAVGYKPSAVPPSPRSYGDYVAVSVDRPTRELRGMSLQSQAPRALQVFGGGQEQDVVQKQPAPVRRPPRRPEPVQPTVVEESETEDSVVRPRKFTKAQGNARAPKVGATLRSAVARESMGVPVSFVGQ